MIEQFFAMLQFYFAQDRRWGEQAENPRNFSVIEGTFCGMPSEGGAGSISGRALQVADNR